MVPKITSAALSLLLLVCGCGAAPFFSGNESPAQAHLTISSTVNFGSAILGVPVNQLVTIGNSGTASANELQALALQPPFHFTGGNFPGTNGNCGSALPAGSSCTLDITFTPVTLGQLSSSLKLSYHNAGNADSVTSSLAGTGIPGLPGTLDLSFGTAGTTGFDSSFNGFSAPVNTIQPDGKIIIFGDTGPFPSSAFNIERLNVDGTPDTTFGTGGITSLIVSTTDVTSSTSATLVQPDGKIIFAGDSVPATCFAVFRLNADGTPDTSFGTGGSTCTPPPSFGSLRTMGMALQTGGKTDVTGISQGPGFYAVFTTMQYNTDGSLDGTFGTAGVETTPIGGSSQFYGLAIQPDNKIVAVGITTTAAHNEIALVRYTSAGIPDPAFGSAGIVTTDFDPSGSQARGMALQSNGAILISVSIGNGNYTLCRYLTDGSPDSSFGTAGCTPQTSVQMALPTLTSDGRIVVGTGNEISRYWQ